MSLGDLDEKFPMHLTGCRSSPMSEQSAGRSRLKRPRRKRLVRATPVHGTRYVLRAVVSISCGGWEKGWRWGELESRGSSIGACGWVVKQRMNQPWGLAAQVMQT